MILNLWRKNIREVWIKVSVNIDKKIRNKIDNLKSTNPKEYWKVLNSRRKQHSPDIPINIFLDYFKTLNLENPTEEENQNDIERLNIVLNSSITADEIQKSLK